MNDSYKNQQDCDGQFVIGFRLFPDKTGEFNQLIYEKMSQFCNKHGYDIKDCRPDYFEIAETTDLSSDILAEVVRLSRDAFMNTILAKADRYEKQSAAGLPTADSLETYKRYLLYLEYLRKIPETDEFPNIKVLDFVSWNESEKTSLSNISEVK